MVITHLDPTADEYWDELVGHFPDSTFFHSSQWARVISNSYGYTPHYFVVQDSGGACIAAFPFFLVSGLLSARRLVCLPFTDFCGPLILHDADFPEVCRLLDAELRRMHLAYVEFRGPLPDEMVRHLRIETRLEYASFVLDLSADLNEI